MPAHFSATKAAWKVSASTARPKTAQVSQIASPIHIAARNGSTGAGPRESTRADQCGDRRPGRAGGDGQRGGEGEQGGGVEHGAQHSRRGRRWNGRRGLRAGHGRLRLRAKPEGRG